MKWLFLTHTSKPACKWQPVPQASGHQYCSVFSVYKNLHRVTHYLARCEAAYTVRWTPHLLQFLLQLFVQAAITLRFIPHLQCVTQVNYAHKFPVLRVLGQVLRVSALVMLFWCLNFNGCWASVCWHFQRGAILLRASTNCSCWRYTSVLESANWLTHCGPNCCVVISGKQK